MAFSSWLIKKGDFKKTFFFSVFIGVTFGAIFSGIGIFLGKPKLVAQYIMISLGIGAGLGILIGWFSREIILGLMNLVLTELEGKVGLERKGYTPKNEGFLGGGEMEIFDQMFRSVVSVLKRVLMISLRLEEASTDLDKTAQISSQVIKEIVDKVAQINKSAVENASNLRETICSLENSFSLSKD
ncbi:hypothetical protein HYY75_10190, partial [bacterium]|nr:hypothetical protein [bacterium]